MIQLPPDLFFGTTIATCIVVLKKSKADNKTLFIDASKEFVRQGNKNKLTEANRQKILDAFTARADTEHFATLVENGAIAENGYNIAVSSYVEAEDTREAVDIKALNAEIARIVARQAELRRKIDAIVADLEGDAVSRIDDLIAKLCPRRSEFKALGEIGRALRRRSPKSKDYRRLGTAA